MRPLPENTLTLALTVVLTISSIAAAKDTDVSRRDDDSIACLTECNWTYEQCLTHASNTPEKQSWTGPSWSGEDGKWPDERCSKNPSTRLLAAKGEEGLEIAGKGAPSRALRFAECHGVMCGREGSCIGVDQQIRQLVREKSTSDPIIAEDPS
ncbi:MAG: hypothetical protein Q9199_001469 [Rusavskia elegans]